MQILPQLPTDYDPAITVSDALLVEKIGDAVLMGKWFVFLKAEWLKRSGMDRMLAASGIVQATPRSAILFRGKEEIALPGATIAPTPLPYAELVSLTSDKALYRAQRDAVRLLVVAPLHPNAEMTLRLHLGGNAYAEYPLTLDEHGLCLWSTQELPEGVYDASVDVGEHATTCHFEVAEYRLAPLNAELTEQQLNSETLRYTLSVTTFGQPYSGPIEVELQERGKRIGKRETLNCNREGQCRGVVKLSGAGPFMLNVFAGERTATVVLKGSEQERREALVISELGEVRMLSLLPLPQSNVCRGMYIARGPTNTEPFLVRRVVGSEVEITPRAATEMLRVVVVDPVHGTSEETLHEQVKAEQSVRVSIPAPYGIVLLGALIEDKAWEGWCTVLCPSALRLQCEAPAQAKPGAHITVTLKTGRTNHIVPVQLIVKDQRVIAPSDPQVELAACIKENLSTWREQSRTGEVERQLTQLSPYRYRHAMRAAGVRPMAMPFMAAAPMPPQSVAEGGPQYAVMDAAAVTAMRSPVSSATSEATVGAVSREEVARGPKTVTAAPATATLTLTKMRLQFPEVVFNQLIKVQGETKIEVKLGESMTRYSIEAFALAPETLDWERVETTVDTVQPVYGELTVSPFVFPGDPVLGRLDVAAASGAAIVEVRHDGEIVPLFYDDGNVVTPGLPIPSGSVIRFPVRPGAITASVRDARKGGIDISERYVTEPGQLRHILRRTRILLPDEVMTLQELNALEIKPLPGLERPFQFFVESATRYPFGCIEQTSTKILAMFVGYITNQEQTEVAREYETAIYAWVKRLKSMYLPQNGFCMYPPEESGNRAPDTHYAPSGVKQLLNLPTSEQAGIKQKALRNALDEIRVMATDAAAYYKIDFPPRDITDCQAAYQMIVHGASQKQKDSAAAYIRSRLQERNGSTFVEVASDQAAYQLYGKAVSTREETAYAAAALLVMGEASDLPRAIAATNYLTSQFNAEGRLYSTVDTAACLAVLLGLRDAGVVTSAESGRVLLNGQEMRLVDALAYGGKIEALQCVQGVMTAQITSEAVENWSTFKSQLQVEVGLERDGQPQQHFKVGDALELVIRVPRYEPGLLAHVCLPDALARVVGGGQVKRFSLDFCGRNELRVPLAAVSSTVLPMMKDAVANASLRRWLEDITVQHWAVVVRNMFKEEEVGNPGLLEVRVK